MDSIVDDLRKRVAEGLSESEAIASMHSHGLSILDAIKATRELFCVDLGLAKTAVSSHPSYAGIAAKSAPFQNELLQVFQDGDPDTAEERGKGREEKDKGTGASA